MKTYVRIFCYLMLLLTANVYAADQFSNYYPHVKEATTWLKAHSGNAHPTLMIVLTGGVDGPEKLLTDKKYIKAADIPHFPHTRVQGHAGKLVFGKLDGVDVVLLKGRYHYYEGWSPRDVVFPYFVLNALGVKSVITVNAVGGIREDLNTGDLVLVTDHINGMGVNPLWGIAIQRKEHQFTDMTSPYYPQYQELAKTKALQLGFVLKEGIYLSVPGPSYETKSEIGMFRKWGADTIGMSTALEVIASNFLGMKVLSMSIVTNPAADRHQGSMDHKEVIDAVSTASPKISALVTECAKEIVKS